MSKYGFGNTKSIAVIKIHWLCICYKIDQKLHHPLIHSTTTRRKEIKSFANQHKHPMTEEEKTFFL